MSWRWRGVAYEYHRPRAGLYCAVRRVSGRQAKGAERERWHWRAVRSARFNREHREEQGWAYSLREAQMACERFARRIGVPAAKGG